MTVGRLEVVSTQAYCSFMPYEFSFTKRFTVNDAEIYINQCCWGGDVVRDRLLPTVTANFEDIQTAQEDWGWFIWFRRGPIRLGIDIFCDDPKNGEFRIHLTSRRRKFLFLESYVDTPELEKVRELVSSEIHSWTGSVRVERIDL